ncbi:hypothetical protein PGT21_015085 [Puccinia graminis f. sp. tritici]|uniref:Uncharacterized protein n=1 Tax=Puccinia graminis f. sp. tritici TaxID=56615 RepID=A0A5B0QFZ7_PUCGR|nr:hypothetical protein PGT21_015085 [Puccinia graminis f. sp. tritici]
MNRQCFARQWRGGDNQLVESDGYWDFPGPAATGEIPLFRDNEPATAYVALTGLTHWAEHRRANAHYMLIGSTRETSPKNNELTFNIDLFSCYVWTQNLPDHFARNFLVNRVLSAPNPPTRNPSQPALDFELSRVVIPEVAIIGMGTSQTDKDRPIPIRIPARTLYTPDSFGTPRTIMERTSEKFHLFVPNLTKDQLRHIDVSVSTRRRSKLSPEEHQLLVPNLTREQRKSIAIQDHFAISDTSAEKYLFVPYLKNSKISYKIYLALPAQPSGAHHRKDNQLKTLKAWDIFPGDTY